MRSALAEALERPVPELANPFPGDPEDGADFLQGVLAAAVEPEVELEDPGVARREGAK